ncbi:hypothetical protein [Catellatospora coxensis]|uniref:Uncharacterized protein n=1 Tax=Catellatospora coxensis TaxID=310354 RepID=A0A8J3KIU9_9ACTN|nr:hypothetical protein [Catellatospora coxensis]GIG03867.1 hypothetical protein Cco03nite_05670 [Catellatospora coxensis]
MLLVLGLCTGAVLTVVPQPVGELGPSWRAAQGDGVAGRFVATNTYKVGRHTHIWEGTFTSDDGTVVHFGVELDNAPPDMRVGDEVPALDTGALGVVYVPSGSGPFLINLICLSMAMCPLLATGIGMAVGGLRRRLRRRVPAHGVQR